MFDRDQLARYLRSLTHPDLHAAAVRVRVWQQRLYDEPSRLPGLPGLLGRALALIHSEFGERGWNCPTSNGQVFPPGSAWAKVHADVSRTLLNLQPGDRSAALVISEVAGWLRQVNAVAT